MVSIVALIPARGGSKRVPRKNIREFCGRPLIEWTIRAAFDAGIFGEICVSTDDMVIRDVALSCGVQVMARPAEFAADLAPDILWVQHALAGFRDRIPDAFAILRPTSPFRSAATIRAAWVHLQAHGSAAVDSLRAVEPCKQHPFKMWLEAGAFVVPLVDDWAIELNPASETPVHSMPTQCHQRILAQNASLEMAWSRVVTQGDPPTISGTRVLPWTMPGYEGVDLNSEDDWDYALWLVESGRATLRG